MNRPGWLLALGWLVVTVAMGAEPRAPADPDSDHDGLSDFQENRKYLTDPLRADSDGDGTADGDWHERREFAYSVRVVLKVMRPVDMAALDDDYQDARVLAETKDYVELEVVCYPLNSVRQSMVGVKGWRKRPSQE